MTNEYDRAKKITIQQWSDAFSKVFEGKDRSRAPEELWNGVMASLSGIGESIRRNDYKELFYHSAKTFRFMCGFITKIRSNTVKEKDPVFHFNHDFSSIIAFKYPKVCSHCIQEVCRCDSAGVDKVDDKDTRFNTLYGHYCDKRDENKWGSLTVSDWLGIFKTIYDGRIHLQSEEDIGFHLVEEGGEETQSIRRLIQFRNIHLAEVEGINSEYLIGLSSIEGLLKEYDSIYESLTKKYGDYKLKKLKQMVKNSSLDPLDIKARIVFSKMDLVYEFSDTFSWFCALLLKIREIIDNEDLVEEVKNIITEEIRKDGKANGDDNTGEMNGIIERALDSVPGRLHQSFSLETGLNRLYHVNISYEIEKDVVKDVTLICEDCEQKECGCQYFSLNYEEILQTFNIAKRG